MNQILHVDLTEESGGYVYMGGELKGILKPRPKSKQDAMNSLVELWPELFPTVVFIENPFTSPSDEPSTSIRGSDGSIKRTITSSQVSQHTAKAKSDIRTRRTRVRKKA